jgi:hypothetical protein
MLELVAEGFEGGRVPHAGSREPTGAWVCHATSSEKYAPRESMRPAATARISGVPDHESREPNYAVPTEVVSSERVKVAARDGTSADK